jgi:hypothetical protein
MLSESASTIYLRLLLKMGSIRNSIRPDLNTGEHPSPALERGHTLAFVDERSREAQPQLTRFSLRSAPRP